MSIFKIIAERYRILLINLAVFCALSMISCCKKDPPPPPPPNPETTLTAEAGENQNVVTTEWVYLDGTSSSSSNSAAFSYSWSVLSKPAGSRSQLVDATSDKPCFKPDFDGDYIIQLTISNDSTSDTDQVEITSAYPWKQVESSKVVIDDFEGTSTAKKAWYYSRIGTNRGEMGSGSVLIGNGTASIDVTSDGGWAGVWISLLHNALTEDELNPNRLLGQYIKDEYQASISGIEIDVFDGSGFLKVELKNLANQNIVVESVTLTGGKQTITIPVSIDAQIKKLNFLIDGIGTATIDEVRLQVDSTPMGANEAVFLYSYGHLSQTYDASSGITRDRARWDVESFASTQTIGMFALLSAIASELGFIEESDARDIVVKTKSAYLSLPTYKGVLPHFLVNKNTIAPDTEWSTIDSAIGLLTQILACEAIGEDTPDLENMLKSFDFDELTVNSTRPISMGYSYEKDLLSASWNVFGSESFLMAVIYGAVTGKNDVTFDYPLAPTWDSSGFNDIMALHFFPIQIIDIFDNDWISFMAESYAKQVAYFQDNEQYNSNGLFGLSASEITDIWEVSSDHEYSAWNPGTGHSGVANDGSDIAGFPVVSPHYCSLYSTEQPQAFEKMFDFVLERNLFSVLGNVESLGMDASGDVRYNSLKGSWNLTLQAVGAARVLQQGNYLPYRALQQNEFLWNGFRLFVKQDK